MVSSDLKVGNMQPSNLKIVKFRQGTVGWELIKVNASERTKGLDRVRVANIYCVVLQHEVGA
jgi:hypothetical protein